MTTSGKDEKYFQLLFTISLFSPIFVIINRLLTFMNELSIFSTDEVFSKIIHLRNTDVILDKDIALIYGVETKRINEATKNNPEKFPDGYSFELTKEEVDSLRSKISTIEAKRGQHSKYLPHAFTEKGLYMLATILKSKQATAATIGIIESFAKLREISRNITALHEGPSKAQQKTLMQRTGELIGELLIEDAEVTETESSIELNLMALKFKHTIKRTKKEKE